MKIIIADDEKNIVKVLKEFFERHGHEADTAFEGTEALKKIKSGQYDIAVLDEDMPGMTGLEIVEHIKSQKIGIKTVIITGYPEVNEKLCREMGADAYMEKPLRLSSVLDIVEKCAGKESSPETGDE